MEFTPCALQFNSCPADLPAAHTSFNIQEPIVCTPEQALATFLNSGVDALVIGNYFIERKMMRK